MRKRVVSWVHCGDIHLKDQESLGGLDRQTGLPVRMLDKLHAVEKAVAFSNKVKADYFIVSGDWSDVPNPSERCLYEFVRRLVPIDPGTMLLWGMGNHDTDGNYFAGEHLAQWGDVGLKFLRTYMGLVIVPDLAIHFLPWGVDVREACKAASGPYKFNVLIGHAEVLDAKLTEYEHRRCTAEESIDPSLLRSHFDHVELTHFHTRQPFYIGSLARSSFNEGTDPKGFTYTQIFRDDVAGYVVDSALQDVHDRQFIRTTLENLDSQMGNISGNIVKVVLPAGFPDSQREDVRARLTELGALQVLTPKEKEDRVSVIPIRASACAHPKDVLSDYARKNNVSDETLAVGLEIVSTLCGA